jgi:hypothetical protein
VTTRLRLGTIVMSNDSRHPVLVAHEAASLHRRGGQPTVARKWLHLYLARALDSHK